MFNKSYKNFVKASSSGHYPIDSKNKESVISGVEARKIYLEEIKDARSPAKPSTSKYCALENRKKEQYEEALPPTNKDLFVTVQNNDVDRLKSILDKYPDKLTTVDDYGWSLLMIACQANSIDSAKELLSRRIDISVRDKGGNSARSLVIKNKNYALAEVLLQYKEIEGKPSLTKQESKRKFSKRRLSKEYMCDVCNKTFHDREEHLSSTLHNISASKGRKIPANYVIPASNRGYQLMLKGGWDRDSGLGRDGAGKKYPIKTIQKKDRKGLGHQKKKQEDRIPEDNIKLKSRKMFAENYKDNRQLEINFRREFY